MKTKPTYQDLEKEIDKLRKQLSNSRNEEYFKELMKNNTDAFSVINEKGNNVFQNTANSTILGYTPEERKGRNAFELMVPEDRDGIKHDFKTKLNKDGASMELNFRAYHKDGSIKYIEGTAKNMLHSPLIKGIIVNYRDITERKKTEDTLRKNMQLIELINANTPNVIWKADIDNKGNYTNTYSSDTIDDFLALPRGSMNNNWKKYFTYIVPEYLPEVFNHIKQAITNPQTIFSCDYEVIKENNERAWFSSKGKAVIENGKCTVYGSTIDITERKKTELFIKESEKRFKSLSEATSEAIIFTKNRKIIDANKAALDITGYTYNELLGKTPIDFVLPEHIDLVIKNMLSDTDTPYDVIAINKKGEKIHVEFQGKIFEHNGEKVRVSGIRDITERKNNELELKKLKTAVEQSGSIILITDVKGRIEYVNRKFIKTTGYKLKEVIGKTPSFLNARKQDLTHYEKMWKTIMLGNDWKGEFCNKTKNGKIYWEQATISPIKDKNNKIINFIGVKEDITQCKKNKKELKQRENYLIALNTITKTLSEGDIKNQVKKIPETIGKAAHASRTYIFRNHKNKKGELLLSQVAEYVTEGIKPEIDNPQLQNLSYTDWLPNLLVILKKGNIVNGKVADFGQVEKKLLEPQDIKAILIIPIFIEKEFWGFIGFDNCINDNEWKPIEIEYLKASAEKISSKIKEQRKQKLLENENKRFRTTMDSIDAAVYVADFYTYELLFINKQARELWGDNIGKKCYSVIQKGQNAPCKFCTNHLLLDNERKPKKTYVWEYQNTITKQWFQCRDQAMQWTDGRLVRLEIATDITERKKQEQIIEESEEKYRNIIQNMSDIYYRADANGKLVLGSNSITKILGYSDISEMIGGYIKSVYKKPNERLKFLALLNKNGKVENYRTTLLKKDGSEIFIETTSKMLFDKNGKSAGVEGIVRDITERKKTEQDIVESEKKYKLLSNQFRLMSDNIPDLVWAKDLNGNFTFVNKAVCQKLLIAKNTNEPIGKNDMFFVIRQRNLHPNINDWHTFGELCTNSDELVMDSKKPQRFDEYGNVKGEFLFLDVYKAPIFDDTGKMIGTVGHGRIVTKEKEAEKQLYKQNKEYEILNKKYIKQNRELAKAKEKAEESNRLKSAFLANMSHEIRTPMNAILGFASFLKDKELESEKRIRFVNIINNSGNHLLNLINDIIDISKIDAKQMSVIQTECKLNEFLFEIYQFFHSVITHKSNKLKLLLNKELPIGKDIIKTDTTRLRQILINLIGNAVKFTSSGIVEIKYSIINNKEIKFSIKDTGIGISKEELPIIFKRFRQADETATRKYGGTGLGLAISKACTKLLGGKIWVESEYRKGSTFYFTIPYIPVEHTKNEETISVENKENIFKGKTVLIVEDEPFSRLILEEILKPTKVNLIKAKDGLQAIELCENNPQIDIVLMDIQLPKLSGLQATKEILKIRPRLPIISQTANAMHNDKQKSLDAGCIDYITKPINSKELIAKIANQII